MDINERRYWHQQLDLFQGGYEQIMVEITVHFNVKADELQFGTVMTDTATREVIGMEVHQEPIRLSDETRLAYEVVKRVRLVRDRLQAF